MTTSSGKPMAVAVKASDKTPVSTAASTKTAAKASKAKKAESKQE